MKAGPGNVIQGDIFGAVGELFHLGQVVKDFLFGGRQHTIQAA